MNLCSGSRQRPHDEVCFEGSSCPACEALDERDEKSSELATAEDDLAAAIKELEEMRGSLEYAAALTLIESAEVDDGSP